MATEITVQEYEQAINLLPEKDKILLRKLYYAEPCSDKDEIGRRLGYKGAANGAIYPIGQKIANILNIEIDLTGYSNTKESKGWFFVIHRQFFEDKHSLTEIFDTVKYWDMQPNLRIALENLGIANSETKENEILLENEISDSEAEVYSEGSLMKVWVLKAERSKEAVEAARKIHGDRCKGCHIDFKKMYGDDVDNIIHYHHINPLKAGLRKTNPKTDLFPLCPNCHAVVHSQKQLMTIEDLQNRVRINNKLN